MTKIFKILVLMFVLTNSLFAQQSIPEGNDIVPTNVSPGYPTSASDHCFDIEYVQENCIPVYINVNIHFFLDDNCQGNIATAPGVPANLNPTNAFELAENFINTSNNFFETMSDNTQSLNYQWNTEAHGATTTTSQCIPIRYVLKGVQIHCNTNAQSTGLSFADFNGSFTNGGSEINIFISNVPPLPDGSNPNGFTWLNSNGVVTENFDPAVLNHEIGHSLNLEHTFSNWGDGCVDTWDYNWSWDSDCNGTSNASGTNCWSSEVTINGLNACNLANFCAAHPCCEWSSQNNNLMAYSAWAGNPDYSALTPCQITTMLTNLAEYKCDFITVGGCPPPSAFVGTVPQPANSTKCQTCFYLNGSFNESGYELDILRPNGTKIVSTGEVFNEAGKYCITPRYTKFGVPYWPNGFQSGQEYTIKLNVFNECGDEDQTEFKFTLPPLCNQQVPVPDTIKFVIESISPNPTNGEVTVKYSTKESGQLKVYGANLNTFTQYGIVKSSNEILGDNQQFSLDVTNWQSGVNSLIFEYNGELIIENIIKN